MMYRLLIISCFLILACKSKNVQIALPPLDKEKIKGLTLVAPPKAFETNPMLPIDSLGANWVAIIPYAFTRPNEPIVHYNEFGGQWWGEKPEGIRESIRLAHQQHIKVMLKPQVYVPNGWTGNLDFNNQDWEKWEQSYRDYIFKMLSIAKEESVELFCIGTEFKISAQQRTAFWQSLIKEMRLQYKGKLTYAANWDEFEKITFWTDLDYIGVNAYFALSNVKTPTTMQLCNAWQPHCDELLAINQQYKKPILFTEFGYLSVDNCAWNTWDLEKNIHSMSCNNEAQANALDALFSSFGNQTAWAGGFLWKWFPNMEGHEGYPEKDYTPQGKTAQKMIGKWYNEN